MTLVPKKFRHNPLRHAHPERYTLNVERETLNAETLNVERETLNATR